ncbi:hypothetical protein ABZ829_35790 [Streptomyces xanthochromogenes]|uniref:hypothetical protein n=1 Tax=Streptomyces xanthochromogenes TaxID=67384 RepID=UPI00343CF3BE
MSSSTAPQPDLTARFGHVHLPNPVLTASGCAGYGCELARFFPLDALGALVTKTVMPYVRSGRATPRTAETPGGMLNDPGSPIRVLSELRSALAERGHASLQQVIGLAHRARTGKSATGPARAGGTRRPTGTRILGRQRGCPGDRGVRRAGRRRGECGTGPW